MAGSTIPKVPMYVVCSYCERDLGQRPPIDDERTSHGICEDCFTYYAEQWEGLQLGEFLDRYSTPVVAVDGDGRVMAVNKAMAAMMQVDRAQARGLLGGDFMECVYARLPGGCGQTVHCTSCTIRHAVETTLASDQPIERSPATLTQGGGTVDLLISTTRKGQYVQLVIEDATPRE